jgi:putative oxidoreductase
MTGKVDYANAFARIMLAAVFIYFGITQFMEIASYATRPAVLKFVAMTGQIVTPTALAYIVAAIDLFGGLILLAGFLTRAAGVVLFVFVLLTLYFAHDFWNMEGSARALNQAHFLKNLAVMGGLLLLIAYGPGRCSIDGRRKAG